MSRSERHRERSHLAKRRRTLLVILAVVVCADVALAMRPNGASVLHGTTAAAVAPTTKATTASTTSTLATTTTLPPTTTTAAVKSKNPIIAENARKGTSDWRILGPSVGIEGYADHVSAQRGDDVALYVSSLAPTFHVEAYRMGWYQGLGARLVWKSRDLPGGLQAKPTVEKPTNTVRTSWQKSLDVKVSNNWPPGDYLLKLVSSAGQSYVPLTVRDDASHAAILVVNAVTTWQAYNDWGGYSLYHGPNGSGATRADIVTFDRPYSKDGAGDFIANEHGLVALAEHLGLDVTYVTDIELDEHPELLTNHHVIVSLGHDEYWSLAMRRGVEAARDKGVNVMFLGANALYRRIRLQPSPLGPDRDQVNYRQVAGDTGLASHPDEPTTSWRQPPKADPENSLTGTFYECNPAVYDGVVADANAWMFAGTGMHDGDHVQLLVGPEYDRVVPDQNTPRPIEVMFHSPLRCQGHYSHSDAAYYTTASGAGVFDSGTNAWVCKLFSGCPADRPFAPNPLIQRITANMLRVFAAGPAGKLHPAQDNLAALGITRS
jgi:hypothetical protein